MLFFKKKQTPKEVIEENEKFSTDFVITALNWAPVDFECSEGYDIAPEDALDEARDAVNRVPALDKYNGDFRDSFIMATDYREKAGAKLQFAHKIGSVYNITRQAYDEATKAEGIDSLLDWVVEQNQSTLNQYLALQS